MKSALVPLAAALVLAAGGARAEEMIRVAVRTGVPRTTLVAEGLRVAPAVIGSEGQTEAQPEGRPVGKGKVEVRAGDAAGELYVDGRRWPDVAAAFTADGIIRSDGRELSRWVEVRRMRSGLAVVEVLPMEDYVAGVVSGETPLTPSASAAARSSPSRPGRVRKRIATSSPFESAATASPEAGRTTRSMTERSPSTSTSYR